MDKDSGVRFRPAPGGQASWSLTTETHARLQRFEHFQNFVLEASTPSLGLLAARLVGLDGVSPSVLELLSAQTARPYKMSDAVAIEWADINPTRLERRLLHPMTVLAWPVEPDADGPMAPLKLKKHFIDWLDRCPPYRHVSNPVVELQGDQLCWLQEVLPGTLVIHHTGTDVLSALDRSTWARKECGRPLLQETPIDVSDIGATCDLVQAALDSATDARNLSFIAAAEGIFKMPVTTKEDGHVKRAWAQALGLMGGQLRRSHPAVGVVIAWAAHMCEAGTMESENPAANTVKRYALRAMSPLGQGLSQFTNDVHHWSGARLADLYADLIQKTASTSRPEMSAALGSFHAFLQEWFGTPPVTKQGKVWSPKLPNVNANILWQHEIETCLTTCNSCEDARLGQSAATLLWIARENPVRIQDLLRIRLCNLHFYSETAGEVLEIEVARDAARGRLKTDDAQRRLFVRHPQALVHLRRWRDQRRAEAAPEEALLLGEPNEDQKIYRQAALHRYVNTLVKQVSGDPRLRFHHLRHTRISTEVSALLSSGATSDLSRLDVLAADAGHASPHTTLYTYSHFYEHPFRLWLDCTFCARMKLTGLQSQAWLDDKANTLVQAARRGKLTLYELTWQRLAKRALGLPLPRVDDGFQWGEISAPHMSKPIPSTVSPSVMADVILRLSKGSAPERIAVLLQTDSTTVHALENELKAWLQNLARSLYPRKFQRTTHHDLATLLNLMGADMERMFGERLNSLHERFSAKEPSHPMKTEMRQAIDAWLACGRGDHIALGKDLPARGILRLLRESSVSPGAVRIVHQIDPIASQGGLAPTLAFPKNPVPSVNLHSAIRLFTEEFGCQPVVEMRTRRVDRPDVYLLLSHQPTATTTPSAASCNGVLKAWLVACKGFLLFCELANKNVDTAA